MQTVLKIKLDLKIKLTQYNCYFNITLQADVFGFARGITIEKNRIWSSCLARKLIYEPRDFITTS